MKKITILSE